MIKRFLKLVVKLIEERRKRNKYLLLIFFNFEAKYKRRTKESVFHSSAVYIVALTPRVSSRISFNNSWDPQHFYHLLRR